MPRPQNERMVHEPPLFTEFKPVGFPGRMLGQISLTLDEYEAFRLADHLSMSHEEAAGEMEISRPTFTRLIETARKKISDLIVSGNMLLIEGGKIHFRRNIIRCLSCGHMFNMDIATVFTECPECGSTNLLSLAGGFGHGQCCLKEESDIHHKKGGNHARWRQKRTPRRRSDDRKRSGLLRGE
ncbi:MAG: DUF134 domain-containing protein [Bacteroidales bacterium]|nr:DUF134 domain-containing protein [Bacteroidales bacterium]